MSGKVTEVLVLTTATALPSSSLYLRRSAVVQNLGPNPIFLAFSAAEAVVNKARRLATNDSFTVEGQGVSLWAITTVDQVADAATIVMELQ